MQTPEEYEITLRVNALVKGLKKRRGYTKKDISQKLGIGLTTFNDYLNGVSSFKLGTLIKFASLCKLTLPDILDDTLEAKKLYSEDLADRANTGKNTLDFLAFILLVPAATNAHNTQYLFCFLHILLIFFARKDLNSMTMSLVFLVTYVIADLIFYPIDIYIFPNFNSLIQNAVAFGACIVVDILLIVLLKNRTLLSLWFSKGNNKRVLEKNFIEGPIYAVAIGFLLVDGVAFVENLIRNLEYLGFDESFAKYFWKITYVYDYFEYLKSGLMASVVILLFIGTRIRQQPPNFALT
ncbi:helix-turn-helix domain-containing protein [Pseudoalteromonas xiamenensis]|uniref:Helix-turn-helix transcriptional regulator n=1 Tax=Pseudoalteromonas xiamenensis TaxID=882626 RepID=A0A975DJ82_9GAMM|nr:helix-turn-helix transcriptional regulator [Pseudoalteromonas xiamenensis]QTH72720.1 helix-turn-helix transcriptional regulator [Pseudoalteromonas xiamenensis]